MFVFVCFRLLAPISPSTFQSLSKYFGLGSLKFYPEISWSRRVSTSWYMYMYKYVKIQIKIHCTNTNTNTNTSTGINTNTNTNTAKHCTKELPNSQRLGIGLVNPI